MAVNLGGYDDQSGWYPDDSTNNQFSDDVDLTGDRGSFGPGGFRANPRITGPASGPPPGVSLGTPGASGGAAAANTPNYTSPGQQNLRPGMAPTVRNGPGPYTDVTANQGGGGLWDRVKGFIPSVFGNPVAAGIAAPIGIAAAGYKYGEPASKAMSVDPRIDAAGSGGFDVQQPLGQPPATPFTQPNAAPIDPYGPTRANAPIDPFDANNPPATAAAPQQGMPWAGNNNGIPLNAPGRPRRPANLGGPVGAARRTPASAGPAAVAQQPNMGSYDPNGRFIGIPRVNAPAGQSGGRGGGGGPMQTALNLSGLFGGGQPAAPAPVARAPSIPIGGGVGNRLEAPTGTPVGASSPPVYPDPTIAAGGPGHSARAPVSVYPDPTIAAGGPGHGARARTPDLPFRNWGIFGGS